MKNKIIFISTLVFLGCGNNTTNYSNTDSTNEILMSAQFIDSPVEGIDYISNTRKGVTTIGGYFKYSPNDTYITFKVGNLILGSISVKDKNFTKVFPANLVGVDINNTTDENVIKIIRFLQSLDEDNNVDNGIYISDVTKNKINAILESNSTYKINLCDNNISVIENLVNNLGKKFVLERVARENYAKTLETFNIKPTKMPFITVWKVGKYKNITIPINPNYEYNYTVDWGDGNISRNLNDSITHTYVKEGNYTVKITGKFPAIYFNCNWDNDEIIDDYSAGSNPDINGYPAVIANNEIGYSYLDSYLEELVEIKKWGDIEWESFHHAFAGAINLKIKATDTPNLKNVKDMSAAFLRVSEMPDNLGDWNVSSVEDMSYMFMGHYNLNDYPKNKKSISKWNVSNVKNMRYMFVYNYNFNTNLNEWNVSNVTDMEGMFDFDNAFNQPLDKWDVSNVTNTSWMFAMTSFNQNINMWNVSNVTNMQYMFQWATKFNQPLNNWDVSSVTNMEGMFMAAKSFDQNISMWDVSNVIDYEGFADESPIDGTDKMPHFK